MHKSFAWDFGTEHFQQVKNAIFSWIKTQSYYHLCPLPVGKQPMTQGEFAGTLDRQEEPKSFSRNWLTRITNRGPLPLGLGIKHKIWAQDRDYLEKVKRKCVWEARVSLNSRDFQNFMGEHTVMSQLTLHWLGMPVQELVTALGPVLAPWPGCLRADFGLAAPHFALAKPQPWLVIQPLVMMSQSWEGIF